MCFYRLVMHLRLFYSTPIALGVFIGAAIAATPNERATITQHAHALISTLDEKQDCGEYWRKEWGPTGSYCEQAIASTLFRRFTNKSKDDAFVFFHLGGCCGGSNGATYLAVFSDRGNGYTLLGYSSVGGKWAPVDTSYLKVIGKEVVVRLENHPLFMEHGPERGSYFTKWRIANGRLVDDRRVYEMKGNQLHEIAPNAQ